MTDLFPDAVKYHNFSERFLGEENGGYKTKCHLRLIFQNPKRLELPAYHSETHGFTISTNYYFVIIDIPKGMWYDGVTLALDLESRMLFALAHDCGCWASQESEMSCYERFFDGITYKTIRKQGGSWFNAWRTSVAVKKWDSFSEE